MYDIQHPLFEDKHIVLGPINHEIDPQIETRWANDAWYLRMLSTDPAMPRSAAEIRKAYEEIEKAQVEKKDLFYFSIRMKEDDRLIGFGMIYWIMWVNSYGWVKLGIGEDKDRRHGYGSEALGLLVRFAFAELNLHRLSATIPAYNQAGLGLFHKLGFADEVCRRQAVERDGQRWDMFELGLLASEWANIHKPDPEPANEVHR